MTKTTQTISEQDKLRVAYALNLWTVSISQIVDYNDAYILTQEYDNIINNLNLENMPKDQSLLDVIKDIMDEITQSRINDGDKQMVEDEYAYRTKNAIWSAIPFVGGIFASGDPVAIALSLATQIGTGYMNYRRTKAENTLNHKKARWEIQKKRLNQINALQKQLFSTAWDLFDKYGLPNKYRVTAKNLESYNKALLNPNDTSRLIELESMKEYFEAYPPFWYQLGSTANRLFREQITSIGVNSFSSNREMKAMYRAKAIEYFEKYRKLNSFKLVNNDIVTAAWALEYFELIDADQEKDKASQLINIAEENAGNALDILEICAFDYLFINDTDDAVRLFRVLVNKKYNIDINTQILSCLLIGQMHDSDNERSTDARLNYKQLKDFADPKYIVEDPGSDTELAKWKVEWKGRKEAIQLEKARRDRQKLSDIKITARPFYSRRLSVVYDGNHIDMGKYLFQLVSEFRNLIDHQNLPEPECITLNEYKDRIRQAQNNGIMYDDGSIHYLFLVGGSKEAADIFDKKGWDFDDKKYGIKYTTLGSRTAIRSKTLNKREEITDLFTWVLEIVNKYRIPVPEKYKDIESVIKRHEKDLALLKQHRLIKRSANEDIWPAALMLECNNIEVKNGKLEVTWRRSPGMIKYMQYILGFVKYLHDEKALVCVPRNI